MLKIIRKKSTDTIHLFDTVSGKLHGPYKDVKAAAAARKRRENDDLMRSLGLTKVKGAVSGKTYWE